MKVKSAPGTQTPKEGKPREYITDRDAVDVPDTTYYRRLVRDGSLIALSDQPSEVSKKKGGDK